MRPKRYVLFAGYRYYPAQGWNDFVASADTIKELEKHKKYEAAQEYFSWAQIFDTETGLFVRYIADGENITEDWNHELQIIYNQE